MRRQLRKLHGWWDVHLQGSVSSILSITLETYSSLPGILGEVLLVLQTAKASLGCLSNHQITSLPTVRPVIYNGLGRKCYPLKVKQVQQSVTFSLTPLFIGVSSQVGDHSDCVHKLLLPSPARVRKYVQNRTNVGCTCLLSLAVVFVTGKQKFVAYKRPFNRYIWACSPISRATYATTI